MQPEDFFEAMMEEGPSDHIKLTDKDIAHILPISEQLRLAKAKVEELRQELEHQGALGNYLAHEWNKVLGERFPETKVGRWRFDEEEKTLRRVGPPPGSQAAFIIPGSE